MAMATKFQVEDRSMQCRLRFPGLRQVDLHNIAAAERKRQITRTAESHKVPAIIAMDLRFGDRHAVDRRRYDVDQVAQAKLRVADAAAYSASWPRLSTTRSF